MSGRLGGIVKPVLLQREGMAPEQEAGSRQCIVPVFHHPAAHGQHALGIAEHEAQRVGDLEGQEGGGPLGEPGIESLGGKRKTAVRRCLQGMDEHWLVTGAAVAHRHGPARGGERLVGGRLQFAARQDQVGKALERKGRHMIGVCGKRCFQRLSGVGPVRAQPVYGLFEGEAGRIADGACGKIIGIKSHSIGSLKEPQRSRSFKPRALSRSTGTGPRRLSAVMLLTIFKPRT